MGYPPVSRLPFHWCQHLIFFFGHRPILGFCRCWHTDRRRFLSRCISRVFGYWSLVSFLQNDWFYRGVNHLTAYRREETLSEVLPFCWLSRIFNRLLPNKLIPSRLFRSRHKHRLHPSPQMGCSVMSLVSAL